MGVQGIEQIFHRHRAALADGLPHLLAHVKSDALVSCLQFDRQLWLFEMCQINSPPLHDVSVHRHTAEEELAEAFPDAIALTFQAIENTEKCAIRQFA